MRCASILSSTRILWSLHLLLMCICTSNVHRRGSSDQMCEFIGYDGTIILKKFNQVSNSFTNVKQYLCDRFCRSSVLIFELYPNFKFDPEYFINILKRDGLSITIRFSNELEELVSSKKVKSSDYVDKFLGNLLHTQNLNCLNLSSLNLTEVPRMISKFKNLESLNLEYNYFNDFKFEWNSLIKLKLLLIGESKIKTKNDDFIFNLPSLKTLRIHGFLISQVSNAINKLESLENLMISNSSLEGFAGNLSNLKKIKFISISGCKIEELVINMNLYPYLASVLLIFNHSLKCLKLLISEFPQKLHHFNIIDCPLEEVEIFLNLKNIKLATKNHSDQPPTDFDYVIKFNPSELFRFPKNYKISRLKIYEFDINTNPGLNKTILIKEFNLERTKAIDRDKLIAKWIKICEKIHLQSKTDLHDEYNHSIEFLKDLYEINNDDYSDWRNAFPFEYKEKMIKILSDLFDQLEEENLEFKVESILKIIKRPHLEQLAYFNYLLKYSKSCLLVKEFLTSFIKESIEILKDYFLIIFLNLENYQNAKLLRFRVSDCNGEKDLTVNALDRKVFEELLNAVINAKKNFDSKLRVHHFKEEICNVICWIINLKHFDDDERVKFFLKNCKDKSECSKFEKRENVDFLHELSIEEIRDIVSAIVEDQMLVPIND